MNLHFTKPGGWQLPDGTAVGRQDLVAVGLRADMPFFVREDGAYDDLLNAWLRALPARGGKSPSTWEGYARDVHTFLRFLQWRRQTVDWRTTTAADLNEFKQVRLDEPTSDVRVSAGSWTRNVSALESLFDWAVESGVIAASPFPYRYRATNYQSDFTEEKTVERQNTMRERVSRRPPQYLRLDDYQFFRDVGLRGRLPNGDVDPQFRGRQAVRNALFADLVVSTGMRRSEASSLLLWELPQVTGDVNAREVVVTLAGDVSKNRDPRPVYVPAEVYRRLLRYITVQRSHAVAGRLSDRGEYRPPSDAILVTPCGGGEVLVHGARKPKKLAAFGVRDRRRMVECRSGRYMGPAQLFVTESGAPMERSSWNDVFESASGRVVEHSAGRLGAPGAAGVSPHDLRHTYAVNFLSKLYQRLMLTTDPATLDTAAGQLRTRMLKDPLRTLQLRLGHRSIMSTFVYLQYIEEAQDMAHDAAAEWASDLHLYED